MDDFKPTRRFGWTADLNINNGWSAFACILYKCLYEKNYPNIVFYIYTAYKCYIYIYTYISLSIVYVHYKCVCVLNTSKKAGAFSCFWPPVVKCCGLKVDMPYLVLLHQFPNSNSQSPVTNLKNKFNINRKVIIPLKKLKLLKHVPGSDLLSSRVVRWLSFKGWVQILFLPFCTWFGSLHFSG